MSQVNITRNIRSTFDWQSGNSGWSADTRALIFRRFWANVKRADALSCWPWIGYVGSRDYGVFGIGQTRIRAHRFAWLASRGEIQAGLEVCHTCDNKRCVNPDHLVLGTHQQNHLDAVRKGRKRAWGLQKLNAEQVRTIRARVAAGHLLKAIAQDFGIGRSTVSGIKSGATWAHLDNPALQLGAAHE